MKIIKNIQLGSNKFHLIVGDVVLPEMVTDYVNVVVFCHGFKGFKDWGAWDLVAEEFAKEGFVFLKFNFSHNGVQSNNPVAFSDLKAFGQNSYIREIVDLEVVLSWVFSELKEAISCKGIGSCQLIGHSRGGGIALVKAAEDERITSISTWASIANFNRFGSSEELATWKSEGVKYILNGRTGQQMPQYYELYESYIANQNRLNVESAAQSLDKNVLVVHGTIDKAVGFSHAKRITQWAPKSRLLEVENANHVFNTTHPYKLNHLPPEMNKVVKETIAFFKNQV